jgi:hypothetical protein
MPQYVVNTSHIIMNDSYMGHEKNESYIRIFNQILCGNKTQIKLENQSSKIYKTLFA